jgi:hypothetical protein
MAVLFPDLFKIRINKIEKELTGKLNKTIGFQVNARVEVVLKVLKFSRLSLIYEKKK